MIVLGPFRVHRRGCSCGTGDPGCMWSDGVIIDRRTGEQRPFFAYPPASIGDATISLAYSSAATNLRITEPGPETRQQRALRLARAAASDHGAREHKRPRVEPRPALVLQRPNFHAMPRRLAS